MPLLVPLTELIIIGVPRLNDGRESPRLLLLVVWGGVLIGMVLCMIIIRGNGCLSHPKNAASLHHLQQLAQICYSGYQVSYASALLLSPPSLLPPPLLLFLHTIVSAAVVMPSLACKLPSVLAAWAVSCEAEGLCLCTTWQSGTSCVRGNPPSPNPRSRASIHGAALLC